MKEPSREMYDELSRLNNDLVTLQRQLVRTNRDLDRANLLKTRFLTMASHDLRKPLSILLLYFDLLIGRHHENFSQEEEEFSRIIRKELHELIRRVNELLDIGQIDSGTFRLRPGFLEPIELGIERIQLHRELAPSHGVEIVWQAPEKRVVISADSERLRQVWDNLLDNALRSSPEGARVQVEFAIDETWVHAAITDEGPGISPEMQKQIFEPSGSPEEESPESPDRQSNRFDLVICHTIITRHGGEIDIESNPPGGTTIRFRLPRQNREQIPATPDDNARETTPSADR